MLKANRNLDDLTPEMAKRVRRWRELCKRAGINILITEGHRSLNRQRYLYAFGRFGVNRTKAKVTWTMNSNHLKGEAIDFGFMDNGKFHYNGDWEAAYQFAEMAGLRSLYKDKKVDRPHLNFDHDFMEAPGWAFESLQWMVDNDLMKNERANDPVTRAELAVVLKRFHKFIS